MAMQKVAIGTVLAVALVGMVAIALSASLLTASRTLPNSGNVKAVGVGVYWDSSCTNETSSINWGTLAPNSTKNVMLYIKNNGTVAVTLSMATSGWNPAGAASYLTLNWNCTNYNLYHGNVVTAYLTLSVSPSVSGITSFSFDITITGTEST
jgi:hypothetical protein